MKKIIFAIIILNFIVNYSVSQVTKNDVKEAKSYDKSILVGFKGGPSLCTFSSEYTSWPYVVKHSSGIFIRYFMNQMLAFETGISYEAKGSSIEGYSLTMANGNIIQYDDILFNRNYLTLPMLTSVHFGEKIKFGANLGPYFSFLLSHNIENHVNATMLTSNLYDPDIIDTGVILGLSSIIKVTEKISVNLELRNSYELLGNSITKNQTHTLLLGLEYIVK